MCGSMPLTVLIDDGLIDILFHAAGTASSGKGQKKTFPFGEGLTHVLKKLNAMNYSASATTSFTSGIIRFIIPSIPAFKVIIDDGQPLHEPCNIRFTTPSL